MNSAAECKGSVATAQRTLRTALERWNAADLSSCAETLQLLGAAALELENCRHETPCPAEEVLGIRSDIRHLARLVDAAAAFSRSIAPLAASETYAGPGQVVAEG